ncbi:MAG: SDR family NAD(P)-dependent oxidoreductase [Acidimicrobiales bacterium]
MPGTDTSAAAIFDVDGVRAAVTGAASGLGFAMAEVLALNGARVSLLDANADLLETAVKELAGQGASVAGEVVDVADPVAVERVFGAIAEREGGLDAVFANAGISRGAGIVVEEGQIENADRVAYQQVIDVNLHGVVWTVQAAARVMRPQGHGRIVVTASTAGLSTEAFCGYGYIAAKGGVVNLVRQAALDLARDNVLVNGIAPGPFFTRIGGPSGADPEVVEYWSSTVPLGRMAEPSELHGVVLLLAAPRASTFLTGAIIPVDGGTLIGPPISAFSRPDTGYVR